MLTREIMLHLFPKSAGAVDLYLPFVQAATHRRQINTPRRLAAFLAQVGHESAGFSTLVENLNYSADGLAATWGARFAQKNADGSYVMSSQGNRSRRVPNADALVLQRRPEAIADRVYSDRLGNGPQGSGDGWRYRGRGLIQITGKTNYRLCSLGLFGDMRLLTNPQLLQQWQWAVESAAWYWDSHNVNALADGNDFDRVTRAINGGLNGQAERLALYHQALGLLRA